ncbi:MAG: hypothetical protein ACLQU4_15475 [Limisphaerales bacterium]
MKKTLRILAVVALLGALAFWAVKGAHRGWTVTNIKHETADPVTGLTGVTYERGFIPGLDFLAAAALAAAGLAGVSLLIKNKSAGK